MNKRFVVVVWECESCSRGGESELGYVGELKELVGKEWDECVEKECDGKLIVRGIGVKEEYWEKKWEKIELLIGSWSEK